MRVNFYKGVNSVHIAVITQFIGWMQTQYQLAFTIRPSQPTWAVSTPVGCYCLHLLSPFIVSPKADTHFTFPQRAEGWVDLDGWLHTEVVYLAKDGHPSQY